MRHTLQVFILLFFFCLCGFVLQAQQKHFIYVQSEDKQPFAVVLAGKVYSSSDYGYVIVPKLADGNYNFTVSFPLNKFPDQAFTCSINKKDAGFMLKNSTDGWALENMQTKKLTLNNTHVVAQNNAFGDMLSEVVSDSNLTKKTIIAEEPVDTSTKEITNVPSTETTDTVTIANTGFVTDSLVQIKNDSLVQLEKISESKADTGTNMMFVDKTQNGVDTINVFVPVDTVSTNVIVEQKSKSDTATASISGNQDSSTIAEVVTPDSDTQNIDSTALSTNESTQQIADTTTHGVSNPFYKANETNAVEKNVAENKNSSQVNQTQTINTSSAVKQDCGSMLSDEDLNKLKRKMFVQNGDNNMIQYAVKSLGKKCITTEQVKILGNLFSSDDGRYTLYDALYFYVYDYGNYPLLANQILDPYYKKRFAALLR